MSQTCCTSFKQKTQETSIPGWAFRDSMELFRHLQFSAPVKANINWLLSKMEKVD